jgi:hypothetical protein
MATRMDHSFMAPTPDPIADSWGVIHFGLTADQKQKLLEKMDAAYDKITAPNYVLPDRKAAMSGENWDYSVIDELRLVEEITGNGFYKPERENQYFAEKQK